MNGAPALSSLTAAGFWRRGIRQSQCSFLGLVVASGSPDKSELAMLRFDHKLKLRHKLKAPEPKLERDDLKLSQPNEKSVTVKVTAKDQRSVNQIGPGSRRENPVSRPLGINTWSSLKEKNMSLNEYPFAGGFVRFW
jgi:hypothetical protein